MGGVAHILQSYVREVPLPAILYVGTITTFLVFEVSVNYNQCKTYFCTFLYFSVILDTL